MMHSPDSSKQQGRTTILLSIKPHFAQAILDGKKKFEFRRTLFRDPAVERVVIYASSPIKLIVGEFTIAAVHSLAISDLWRHTEPLAGIDRHLFDLYFSGRAIGHALEVCAIRRYEEPIQLEALGIERPPQSFCYLEAETMKVNARSVRLAPAYIEPSEAARSVNWRRKTASSGRTPLIPIFMSPK